MEKAASSARCLMRGARSGGLPTWTVRLPRRREQSRPPSRRCERLAADRITIGPGRDASVGRVPGRRWAEWRSERRNGWCQMSNVVVEISEHLGRRSSRRQFFKFMTAASLGTGLFPARSGVALGHHTPCVGCGGECPCSSRAPDCSEVGSVCYSACGGGGCPSGCNTEGEWWCCQGGCWLRCSECKCSGHCCRCFVNVGELCGASYCAC